MTPEEWDETVETIASSFEISRKILDMDWDSYEEYEEMDAQRRVGMALFVEHFHSLWD